MVGNPKQPLVILEERDHHALSERDAVLDGNDINHMPRSVIKFLQSLARSDPESTATVVASPIDVFAQQSGRIIRATTETGDLSCHRVKAIQTALGREPQGAVAIL